MKIRWVVRWLRADNMNDNGANYITAAASNLNHELVYYRLAGQVPVVFDTEEAAITAMNKAMARWGTHYWVFTVIPRRVRR